MRRIEITLQDFLSWLGVQGIIVNYWSSINLVYQNKERDIANYIYRMDALSPDTLFDLLIENLPNLGWDGYKQFYIDFLSGMNILNIKQDNINETSINNNIESNKETKFLTIEEAASKYHVDRSTLFKWRQSGKITAIKISRKKVLFDEQKLADELEILTGKNN